MTARTDRSDPRVRAFGLVEILVVMVILVALAAFLYPRYVGNRRTAEGRAATPLAKAHDTECMMNLRSARQAIAAYRVSDDEKYPASLTELRELPKECRECVVSHMPYTYNPQTGEVHCPFPAHQSY